MKQQWKDFGQSLGGVPCVTLYHVGGEQGIFGGLGSIWFNEGATELRRAYKAVVRLKSVNEKIIYLRPQDLFSTVRRLKVPLDRQKQLTYANG